MRFSIVVPVFDNAADLARCLESIGRLDYDRERFEVIVVDNGSTDGSGDVARRFGAVCLEERDFQSSYAARNRGIRAARGEFVAFTDSDCMVHPDWLKAIDAATRDEAAGCFAGEILSATPETLIERFSDEIGLLRQRGPLSGWHFKPYAQTANAVYRRRVFDEIGLFDPTMKSGGDAALAWRMLDRTAHTIVFVPDAIVYHHHRTSVGELWMRFRRYGESEMSWASAQPGYALPGIARCEREVGAELENVITALEGRGGDERELIHPLLRAASRMAHLSGYLQGLLTTTAGGRELDQIPEHARGLVPRCRVCGGTIFVPGPCGRMSDGRAPACADCGSLERHRVLAEVLATRGTLRSTPPSLGVVGEGVPHAMIRATGETRVLTPGPTDRRHDVVAILSIRGALTGRGLIDIVADSVARLRDDGALVVIGGEGEALPSGGADRCGRVGPELTTALAALLPNVEVADRMIVDPPTGSRHRAIVASADRRLTQAHRTGGGRPSPGDP